MSNQIERAYTEARIRMRYRHFMPTTFVGQLVDELKRSPTPSVYVAGPMQGLPLFNFPAFDAAAELLQERGWFVVNPAEVDRQHGFDPTKPQKVSPAEADEFLRRDLDLIFALNPGRGDVIYLLRGWEESKGARVEAALAKYRGLKELQEVQDIYR